MVVKNKQLVNDIFLRQSGKYSFTKEQIEFVTDRYFHYVVPALLHGYTMFTYQDKTKFKLSYIVYSDIPKRHRKLFRYSIKMFGYTFFPVCISETIKEQGYNFKPSKELLLDLADITDTDVVYSLMKI